MGDSDDWASLRQALIKFTRRYGVGRADAEDIVHEVLERFVACDANGAPRLFASKQFLRQVCLNAVRSDYRARVRRRAREEKWAVAPEGIPEPDCALVEKELSERYSVAISTLATALPTQTLRAFMLCAMEGESAPSAAR